MRNDIEVVELLLELDDPSEEIGRNAYMLLYYQNYD